MTVSFFQGDSLDILKTFPDNVFSSLVTDPPASIGLMGMSWDGNKGGRDQWINWLSDILKEALRVLKPGAYGVIWALPRTSHYTAMAAEDAGFEIRDIIHHLSGSGMPTGQNISKAFDKREGKGYKFLKSGGTHTKTVMYHDIASAGNNGVFEEVLPESALAHQWYGWHTRLKPAVEHWILVRKPPVGSVIENVEAWEVGGLNIEASRVPRTDGYEKAWDKPVSTNMSADGYLLLTMAQHTVDLSANKPSGGFPANLVLSHHPNCLIPTGDTIEQCNQPGYCVDGCPVKELNHQSGNSQSAKSQRGKVKIFTQKGDQWVGESTERGFKDSGGASRFFNVFEEDIESTFGYFAKVSNREKFFYCRTCNIISPFSRGREKLYEAHKEHDLIAHPTPKSTRLMKWLITLITPSGGHVLDPFLGTASTAVVCQELGLDCTGIDLDENYIAIGQYRLSQKLPLSIEAQTLRLSGGEEIEGSIVEVNHTRLEQATSE